jgi:hypothetical protein
LPSYPQKTRLGLPWADNPLLLLAPPELRLHARADGHDFVDLEILLGREERVSGGVEILVGLNTALALRRLSCRPKSTILAGKFTLLHLSLPDFLLPLRLDRDLECLLNGFGEKLRNPTFQGSGEFEEFLVGHPSSAVLDLRHHIARNIPTLKLAFGGEFRLADFNFVA